MFIVIVFTVTEIFISGCSMNKEIQQNSVIEPKRVVVVEFSDASQYSYGKIPYDASELLEQALTKTGQITVIPRKDWQANIDETMRDDAISIGKVAGADVVIIGKIMDFYVDHDHNPEAPLLSQRHEYNAITHVKADLIEVAIARHLSTELATGTAEKRTTRFFREGPISVDAIHERSLLNEALQDAARQLAQHIVKQLHTQSL
ncbi:hypothetical protein U27_05853 [Candidatus Vecturithrix granuli]|uniref:ABC-type transport auxiliary lipoprotein component domain-containing protein n=1 Tax=Vecturithrix granuli TaxID=1499967 RepID=A0A081C2S3_VECG1|nr:hypothetical protein U27_05853 [Candidatus Vecturithrix granuli]